MISNIHFKSQSLRDLCWIITSPAMLLPNNTSHLATTQLYQKLWEDNYPWIQKLDRDPKDLEKFLSTQKDNKLGTYSELLLQYFFVHSPDFELLAHNLQVFDSGKTLGEVDFLVKNLKSGKIMHIELAVKFYIGLKPTAKASEFFGPNGNDCLAQKLHKLNEQQIKLTEMYPGKFTDFGKAGDFEKVIFLKGVLFYENPEEGHLEGCSKEHLKGRKITFNKSTVLHEDATYYFPQKKEWLNMPLRAECLNSTEALQKLEELLKWRKAVLLYKKSRQKIERIMFVSRDWPGGNAH